MIIASLLFAGAGLLLMYKGAQGENHARGSFQMNDEQSKSAPRGINPDSDLPQRSHQNNGPDQFRSDSMGPRGQGSHEKQNDAGSQQ